MGYFGWVWGITLDWCGWMVVYWALFWVDGDEWRWAGHYFGWVRVSMDEWGWVHCLIMPTLGHEKVSSNYLITNI